MFDVFRFRNDRLERQRGCRVAAYTMRRKLLFMIHDDDQVGNNGDESTPGKPSLFVTSDRTLGIQAVAADSGSRRSLHHNH